jgi:uncharacterized protein YbjT (DUF2867 family)
MSRRVLVAGATGFVGRHLYPALKAAGHQIQCASRDPDRAREAAPDRHWVRLDVDDPDTMGAALAGCDAAYYLVHGMSGGADYPAREAAAARAFAAAADREGVERVVYLGGVAPQGAPSRHLESRLRVGELLRGRAGATVELRAAMIIGAGSSSWQVVRDLARRLPAMVLPRWLRNHSWPIAIDDVVVGLIAALGLDRAHQGWFDIPGPERIRHRDLLDRARRLLGHRRALRLDLPLLTPRLSSYWIGLVTSVDLPLAKELVEGLRYDLDPGGMVLWDVIDRQPMPLDTAMRLAIDDERADRIAEGRLAQAAELSAR